MLKAWTQSDEGNLLILGLTFTGINARLAVHYPIENFVTLRKEVIGTPIDVVLVTAKTRAIIAGSMADALTKTMVASCDTPIWHFVRTRNKNKILHVCMDREEMMALRKRPLVSFYRLSGPDTDVSFDTLLLAGASEQELVGFLRQTRMLTDGAKIDLDNVQLHC